MQTDYPTTELELTKICGIVERIIFHNPDNGFYVLKVLNQQYPHGVTVTGNIPAIETEEHIEAHGQWVKNKNYGYQLKSSYLTTVTPNTLEGIEKYLASGLVDGIGKHHAKQLVRTFGENVFDIIANDPQQLTKIKGIGKKRIEKITETWTKQQSVRELVMFSRTARRHNV